MSSQCSMWVTLEMSAGILDFDFPAGTDPVLCWSGMPMGVLPEIPLTDAAEANCRIGVSVVVVSLHRFDPTNCSTESLSW